MSAIEDFDNGAETDTINSELDARLAALESPEYRESESYQLGDRVVYSSAFWLGVGILTWVITIIAWH
ncbi:hypothetical protein HH308_06555 [Gordonia sp. TBRC 11910]|uniref:Uncharacterized protein n=1 Tax=Gordonia asplenii TaxID=2725283 RepID=A0A848KWN5_9ACTN|nr:hypothetical protein [Gordonia asplenii]NMO00873.1 hypothetical protein [Gordonia asplenii]